MSSRSPNRPPPPIPDHEVLRKIGFGSYGEVWLARGVTGAWRAVKVVYRDDFDDAHSFEREFNGILAYEPLSRRCEGLVEILHVGRNRARGFYYYVMELGDDETQGRNIQPVDYQPRTLRGDLLRRGAFPLAEAHKVAWQLADATAFLHEHGLVHRDIKPANVIFVDGNAKLADIGLVAALGQRTYVGTEGFSPPEGPGSVQADVYAVGKVIYEMATGKDRLDFPEPPQSFESDEQRTQWLALDAIICKACAPDPRRRYRDGRALERAVDALQRRGGQPEPWVARVPKRVWAGALLVVLLAGGLLAWRPWERGGSFPQGQQRQGVVEPVVVEPPVVPKAKVRIWSQPSVAAIWIDDELVGETSLLLEDLEVGSTLQVELRKTGYRPLVLTTTVTPNTISLGGSLEYWAPPLRGSFWVNSLGMEFAPLGDGHTSKLPLTALAWDQWPEGKKEAGAERFTVSDSSGRAFELVAMEREGLQRFLEWLTLRDRAGGYLEEFQFYEAQPLRPSELQRMGLLATQGGWAQQPAWRLRVREHQGLIDLSTTPDHARVEMNGVFVGYSPLVLPNLEPGDYALHVRADGYEPWSDVVTIRREEGMLRHVLQVPLELSDGLRFGQRWINSVSLELVPVEENLMAATTETTVGAYRRYAEAVGLNPPPEQPSFRQGENHPQVMVNREDAQAFCRWLTETERASGRISAEQVYRLPTDAEWSRMAELEEAAGTAAQLDGAAEGYAWGLQWPPPRGSANFGVDVDDGFAQTAPVGQFRVRNRGLRDLSGNVWEWVSDAYDPANPLLGIVRGGSFRTNRDSEARLSSRNVLPASTRDESTGFRIVLERLPSLLPPGSAHAHSATGAGPGTALQPPLPTNPLILPSGIGLPTMPSMLPNDAAGSAPAPGSSGSATPAQTEAAAPAAASETPAAEIPAAGPTR